MKINTQENNRGFTIVELIIVVIVIGILASISIVGYGTWQKNSGISVVKNDLKGAKSAMESARNFNGSNGYPLSIPLTFSPSGGVTLTYKYGDAKSYCIQGVSSKASTSPYYITNAGNATAGSCP